ncbi:MAG: ABC transporter ATP-binding protein [Candidatus Fermentibacteraceae bacterium]|nr:ABC transporter ATP-binding protein [Candidatus Fermentibacteraceae bacterium]
MINNLHNEKVIEARGVIKTYDDSGVPVHAVRGIDYTLMKGEFTAIIGPSGSGKTTFLNVITGLDTPTEGEVWLSGKLLSKMSGNELSDFRRDHIGFVFQAYNLFPVLTVEENVEYIMLLQGVAKEERHSRVMNILEKVDLEDYAHRLPSRLSGGQQQRVAVARAMVSKPSLVIADEPTANLDSKTSGALLDMMRQLNEDTGMTFLFSTHDEIVMKRARKLVVLTDGKLDGNNPPEEYE